MQIHTDMSNTRIGTPFVNQPDNPDSFICWYIGDFKLYIMNEAEIDELIKAACLAKDRWREHLQRHGKASEPEPQRVPAPPAGAYELCEAPKPGIGGVVCQRPAGHAGGHKNFAKDDCWPNERNECRVMPAPDAKLTSKVQSGEVLAKEQCQASAVRTGYDEDDDERLYCWLRIGHQGNHFDEVDDLWWTEADGKVYASPARLDAKADA